jgi:hypothetical protein
MAAPTLPAPTREIRVERPKGPVTRAHEVVNRALCTIALVLSIVALVVPQRRRAGRRRGEQGRGPVRLAVSRSAEGLADRGRPWCHCRTHHARPVVVQRSSTHREWG